jgi:hypothetical protein
VGSTNFTAFLRLKISYSTFFISGKGEGQTNFFNKLKTKIKISFEFPLSRCLEAGAFAHFGLGGLQTILKGNF